MASSEAISAPIGMLENAESYSKIPQWNANIVRCRAERQEARNYLAQVKIEDQALKLCADQGFIAKCYDRFSGIGCTDQRAQAAWGKIIAEITRLGKREPANSAQTAINQGVIINVNVIQAATKEEIMAEIPDERFMRDDDTPDV